MIADEENYNARAGYYDINAAALPGVWDLDLVLSTVVFMFLDPDQIPAIIKNMQERTVVVWQPNCLCHGHWGAPLYHAFPFTLKRVSWRTTIETGSWGQV